MKKKILEVIIASLLGLTLSAPVEAEREIIELPWDFGTPEIIEETPQYNRDVLARVCMSEASTEPFIGKMAVVATVLNRADMYGKTVEQVAYSGQYSTQNNGAPTDEVYAAVDAAIAQRDLFPADMLYFRTGHYHSFGVPYTIIGAHYFSCQGE